MGGEADAETRGHGDAEKAFEEMWEAYDNLLHSIRGSDGKPAQATELERIALMNRVRRRFAVNAKMPPGYSGAMTVRETARQLGLRPDSVYRLCREGRLNPTKVDGRLYIIPEEVRAYRRMQEIWAAAGGRWTPYGRKERQAPEPAYRPVGDAGTRGCGDAELRGRGDCAAANDGSPERWVRAGEAKALLNVRATHLRRLAKRHGLDVRRAHEGPKRSWFEYRLEDILRLAAERDLERWRSGTSPQRWNRDLLHPMVRREVAAPPGDRLITREEAAEILGICKTRVSHLVAQGRLFGWQERPGRSGCRLYLSERQVLRYGADPMRVKRRLARVEGRAPEELRTGSDWTEWREWRNLARYTNAHADLDRGEFVTAAQAAELLGIQQRSVRMLITKGRLQGHKRKPGERNWWFLRREDVENLLTDQDYARRRRGAGKGLATILERKSQAPCVAHGRNREE